MAKKTLYYHLAVSYGIIADDKQLSGLLGITCSSESDNNPSGIPTMGRIIKTVRDFCKKRGQELIEGQVTVMSITKITKAQYDALNDTKEPDGTDE